MFLIFMLILSNIMTIIFYSNKFIILKSKNWKIYFSINTTFFSISYTRCYICGLSSLNVPTYSRHHTSIVVVHFLTIREFSFEIYIHKTLTLFDFVFNFFLCKNFTSDLLNSSLLKKKLNKFPANVSWVLNVWGLFGCVPLRCIHFNFY